MVQRSKVSTWDMMKIRIDINQFETDLLSLALSSSTISQATLASLDVAPNSFEAERASSIADFDASIEADIFREVTVPKVVCLVTANASADARRRDASSTCFIVLFMGFPCLVLYVFFVPTESYLL